MDRSLAVAPMMGHTDRHFRYFLRVISPRALLYTEMITVHAMIHGDRHKLLEHHPDESPVALQLGGNHPADMATCAVIAEDHGYDEVNFNVGCPSNRVQLGRFGACLMAEPEVVAECVKKMSDRIDIPVTVKTRIGVENCDSYKELCNFVNCVSQAGCKTFIIHARKAWLKGLSPKQNRHLPLLNYERVYRLKEDFPSLNIVINGGLVNKEQIVKQFDKVDGVMVGRAICRNPFLLADLERCLFGNQTQSIGRHEVLDKFVYYVQKNLQKKVPLGCMTRHITRLFHGQRGSKAYRHHLSEYAHKPSAGVEVIHDAASKILPMVLGNVEESGVSETFAV